MSFGITEAFVFLYRIEVLGKLTTFVKLSGVEEQLSSVAKRGYSSVPINREAQFAHLQTGSFKYLFYCKHKTLIWSHV